MKKGEKARLDVAWWKKNKSVRLRSKDFELALGLFISRKRTAETTKIAPEMFLDASNFAANARDEAKKLEAKCGIGQGETKAVLADYVKLLSKEATELNKQHLALAKDHKSADAQLTTAEKALKSTGSAIEKLDQVVKQMVARFDMVVAKIGAGQMATNVKTVEAKLTAYEKDLDRVDREVNRLQKSGALRGKDITRCDKLSEQGLEFERAAYAISVEISGLKLALNKLSATAS